MAQSLWILNVTARGAAKFEADAYDKAAERLETAAAQIRARQLPSDPGITLWTNEPGGGGGPCAPEYVSLPVPVTPSGLPEARGRD